MESWREVKAGEFYALNCEGVMNGKVMYVHDVHLTDLPQRADGFVVEGVADTAPLTITSPKALQERIEPTAKHRQAAQIAIARKELGR